ncbi:MAG: class III signal peptide-containing protein [Candidatus Omnitrophota bacterium]
MKMRNKKGQSTLEYIILVTAVVAVAIVFLRPNNQGKLFQTVEGSYNSVADGLTERTTNLTGSWN